MIDIFYPKDVHKLLNGKHVLFLGDSNVRALYKDMLLLSQKTRFITDSELKKKMEKTFSGDKLIYHGPKSNGRNFKEEREITSQRCKFSYCFLTRVYNRYTEEKLKSFTSNSHEPDVLIISSCVWDLCRWGPRGVDEYKVNLKKLMTRLQEILSQNCLVIWLTCLPIASEIKGGFLVKELEFLKYSLRFHVMEANHYAHKVVVSHGYDVVDIHYHFKMQLHRRTADGVHWKPPAIRYITNLLLTHISLAWGTSLPHRYECVALQQPVEATEDDVIIVLPKKQKTEKRDDSVSQNESSVAGGDKNKVSSGNNGTPKTSKKKKKRGFLKRQNSKAESHHAFISRVEFDNRKKRIRQWQPEASIATSSFNHPTTSFNTVPITNFSSIYPSSVLPYTQSPNFPPTLHSPLSPYTQSANYSQTLHSPLSPYTQSANYSRTHHSPLSPYTQSANYSPILHSSPSPYRRSISCYNGPSEVSPPFSPYIQNLLLQSPQFEFQQQYKSFD